MKVPKRAAPKVLSIGLGAELASDMAMSMRELAPVMRGRDTRTGLQRLGVPFL